MNGRERSLLPDEAAAWLAVRAWLGQRFALVDEQPGALVLAAEGEQLRVDLVRRVDLAWLIVSVPVGPARAIDLQRAVALTSELALANISFVGDDVALRLTLPLSLPLLRLEQLVALSLAAVAHLRADAAVPGAELIAQAHGLYEYLCV
jgi:hypothetical protein